MNIYWGKGTFVINKISSSILFATTRTLEPYAPPYIEKIAPESMTREKYINPSELTYIIDDQILKKSGSDYFIILTIPIEVNGELKNYEFKYRVSFVKEKKKKKYAIKRLKKIKKILDENLESKQ